jgi:hypothetical protein
MTCNPSASSATTPRRGFLARLASTLGLKYPQAKSGNAPDPLASSSMAAFGPAMTTPHSLKPDGGKSTRDLPDLTRRAMSLHNRDRSGAERYLRLHRILSRKDCSND